MSPRSPFDDEDSDTIDSFRILRDEPDFPEGIDFETDGIPEPEDGIPLLDDVVSLSEEQRAPGCARFGPAHTSERSEAVEGLTAAVRDKLESELGQIVAEVIDEALRPAILDLETSLRGEIFEALRQRLAELIEEHLRNNNPPDFDDDF